jgi:hypothetical protein
MERQQDLTLVAFSHPTPVSPFTPFLVVWCIILVAAAVIALLYAVSSAEDGFEDPAGFHSESQHRATDDSSSSTVDTGNPWDQVEGACCPLDLRPSLGPNHFSSDPS